VKFMARRILAGLDRDWAREAPFGIRLARPQDHGAICKLFVAGCNGYQWSMPPAAYTVYVTDLLDLEARLGVSQLLLGHFRDQPVGTIAVESPVAPGRPPWPSSFAGIRGLAVMPAARKQGVGAALLEECMERARQGGATAIGVHLADFMTSALGFYQRFGFQHAPAFDYDGFRHYPELREQLPLRAYVARLG
jgi:ribosomal protein S18 acetylase RimI-like enzyme